MAEFDNKISLEIGLVVMGGHILVFLLIYAKPMALKGIFFNRNGLTPLEKNPTGLNPLVQYQSMLCIL